MSGCDVLVIGAGPTGLTAATALAVAGHRVSLVEGGPRPGGMSASFDVAGQRVDFGSHRLHGRADPGLLEDLRNLLGDDLQTRERNGRIRIGGRWIAFPLRATDLVRRVSPRFALGAAFDSLTAPFRRPNDTHFADTVRARLGPTVFDGFYGPYSTKLWGVPGEALDASLADRRVSAGSPVDIARRLLSARRPEGRVFHYPRHGYGQISEALADRAVAEGVDLRYAARVDRLSIDSGTVTASVDGSAGVGRVAARTVISTIPAQRLVAITDPTAPPAVVDAADRLVHRGMALVYLVVPRSQYTPFDAHYFPGEDTVIARLSEPKNYRDGPDPADQTVLCAEIACTVGDELWHAGPDEVGDLVARQLVAQGLPDPDPTFVEVRRLPHVYPVYTHGYRSHLDEIESWVAALPRVLTVGRQGLFVPDNLHHAIAMGAAAAEVVGLDGTIDRVEWDKRRAGFRAHVVED